MRKFLTIILASFCLTGVGQAIYTVDDSNPYSEDFNSNNGNWYADNTGISSGFSAGDGWDWGDPVGTVINQDASSNGLGNAWVTDLDGNDYVSYSSFDTEYRETDIFLFGPGFNMSNLTDDPYLSFDIQYDLNSFFNNFTTYDIVYVEVTTDGSNWSRVGSINDLWYNGYLYVDDPPFGGQGWTGDSEGWRTVTYKLDNVSGESNVNVRIVVHAMDNDQTNSMNFYGNPGEGVAIDNIYISSENIETDILTASLTQEIAPAIIDAENQNIRFFVPTGTTLTALKPTFTLSNGATSNLTSGSSQDFTSSVTYTITSENGLFSTDWTLEVEEVIRTISIYPEAAIPGTKVLIKGNGFSETLGESTVSFGGTAANVISASSTGLVVEVPDKSVGIANVIVTTNGVSTADETNFSIISTSSPTTFQENSDLSYDNDVMTFETAIADFDNDGDLDIAYDQLEGGNYNVHISYLENGVINSQSNSYIGLTQRPYDLVAADMNNDGYKDLVFAGDAVTWYKNNGDGTWVTALSWNDPSGFASFGIKSLRVFDIDNDFDNDIVVHFYSNGYYSPSNSNAESALTLRNNGDETFTLINSPSPLTKLGKPIDYDNDGDIDMVYINSSGQILLASNDGTGATFTESTIFSTGITSMDHMSITDLDNDGDLDFIFSNDNGTNSVIGYVLRTGVSSYSGGIISSGTVRSLDLKSADINGDGLQDIIRTIDDNGTSKFEYRLNGDLLSFADPVIIDDNIAGVHVAPFDFDEDGDIDLIQEAVNFQSLVSDAQPVWENIFQTNDIITFTLPEQNQAASINASSHTVNIEVTNAADVSQLTPTITNSNKSQVSPASGVQQDFSSAVDYTVTAENGDQQIWTVTVDQVPDVPVLTTSDNSQTTLNVYWQDIAYATQYELQVATDENFTNLLDGYDNKVVSSSPEQISGLTAGTQYYARMRARNNTGTYTAYSTTLNLLTAPANVAFQAISNESINPNSFTLSWTAAVGVADSYRVTLAENEALDEPNYAFNTTETSITIDKLDDTTPLVAGSTYYAGIRSINSSGNSGLSTVLSVLTKPVTPVLNAINTGDLTQSSVPISWTAVTGTVDDYSIELSTTDFSEAVTLVSGYPESTSGTEYEPGVTDSNPLTAGTNYWIRIRANNGSGASPYSNALNFLTLPGDPEISDPSDITQTSAQLNWGEVASAMEYHVQVSSDSFETTVVDDTTTNANFVIEDLTAGQSYDVRIRSKNETGVSSFSTGTVLTLPADPVLVNPAKTSIDQTSATLTWEAVSGTVSGYQLEVSSTEFSAATLLEGYPVTVTGSNAELGNITDTEALQAATNYYVRVLAKNESGSSNYSNEITFLTRPGTPTAISATDVSAKNFSANWEAVTGADRYRLEVSNDNFASKLIDETTSSTSFEVTGLEGSTQYQYRLVAANATGETPFSNIVTVTTLVANENDAPTDISLDNTTFDENQAIGSSIATLATSDLDADDSHIYTLVTGTGDTNNDSFTIEGNRLVSNQVYDFETKSSYTVRIQTVDKEGAAFSKAFTITIADVNDAPSLISLSETQSVAFSEVGTTIGVLSADDDDDETHSFSFSSENESFQIEENELQNKVVFANEVDSLLSVTVKATDDEGASITQTFEITIEPFVDTEAPQIVNVVNPETILSGGEGVSISADITDFRLSEVRLFKKLLTASSYESLVLTSPSETYAVAISESDLGEVGIDFYFEAEDASGNTATSAVERLVLEFPESGEESPVIESITRFGGTIRDYQILAIPYLFSGTNNRVDVIFDEYDDLERLTDWRLISYSNAQADLVDLTDASQLRIGEGYFFIAREQREIRVGQAQINTEDPFTISLKANWNLIGNPFNVDIDWDKVLERNGITDEVKMLRVLNPEDPSGWPESNVLKKFEGAFVQANEDIEITISYQDVVSAGGRKDHQKTMPEVDWYLPITLSQGDRILEAGIGMDQLASDGIDGFDELTLPRWFEYLEVSFLHPEHSFGRFSRDVVQLTEEYEWEFEIAASGSEPIHFTWDSDLIQAPSMYLMDMNTQQVIDMNQSQSYATKLSSGRFKILYTEDANTTLLPSQLKVSSIYPNPAHTSWSVSLSIPEEQESANYQVAIKDLMGRTIWQAPIMDIKPGSQILSFEKPKAIEAGVYMVEIKRSGDAGIISQQRIIFN